MVDERLRHQEEEVIAVNELDKKNDKEPKQTAACLSDCIDGDNIMNDNGAVLMQNDSSTNGNNTVQVENDGQQQPNAPQVSISDLLGEYGNYQLFLTVITLLRYVCLAMMTNTGPLIAPPLTFWCQLPQQTSVPLNDQVQFHMATTNITIESLAGYNRTVAHQMDDELLKNKCLLRLNNGNVFECSNWTYDQSKSGITLTDAYNLICDRDWLRSAFQSSISIGVAIASVVFGATSDEHGRRFTMNVSLAISFLSGLISYWAPNFLIYTLTRSLCTMCDLCIAGTLYTIIVETLGNKYRGIVCLVVTTGWSLGVMIMPWVTGYFRDFRKVMLFTVACHVATIPFLMLVGESPRWLLINGQIDEVKREIHRICCSWNFVSKQKMIEVNDNFDKLKLRYIKARPSNNNETKQNYGKVSQVVRTFFGSFSKIGEIFKSKELMVTTLVFIWIIFNSELVYMILIFFNSDHDDNVKINYAIGGLMESLATLISIVLISSLTRRLSLSSTLSIISIALIGLAFTYDKPAISVYTLNLAKLAGSTLTSLVFVIITELFPTSLRQTGSGIAVTMGSCGAIIAPFVHNELSELIGFRNVLLILGVLPLTAVVLIPFYLRETKGVELADNIDEIEP